MNQNIVIDPNICGYQFNDEKFGVIILETYIIYFLLSDHVLNEI